MVSNGLVVGDDASFMERSVIVFIQNMLHSMIKNSHILCDRSTQGSRLTPSLTSEIIRLFTKQTYCDGFCLIVGKDDVLHEHFSSLHCDHRTLKPGSLQR